MEIDCPAESAGSMAHSSSGLATGFGRSNSSLSIAKSARFAPMPSASVRIATTVKPGFFSSWRKANRRSLNMTDRISEREIFNEYQRSMERRFPFVPAQLRRWLKPAHVIESNCFCIGRAKGRNGRSGPKRQQNQQLSRRDDSQPTDFGVRAWDLVVPRMGLIGGEMPSAWPDISSRFCALHVCSLPRPIRNPKPQLDGLRRDNLLKLADAGGAPCRAVCLAQRRQQQAGEH